MKSVPVSINIMDKEYKVSCPEGEREELVASASLLDTRMREIRDSGKVVGAERIAVMAALNLTHELIQLRTQRDSLGHIVTDRLEALHDRLERALEQEQ